MNTFEIIISILAFIIVILLLIKWYKPTFDLVKTKNTKNNKNIYSLLLWYNKYQNDNPQNNNSPKRVYIKIF